MKLVVTMFTSIDGVAQAPGGPKEDTDGGFDQGGWVVPHFDDATGEAVGGWFATADAFLLGRKTYEMFAGYWPHAPEEEEPVRSKLNELPKYVASRGEPDLAWNNSRPIDGELTEAVGKLKEQPGRDLQVHGSPTMAQHLLGAGLVDELRVLTFPVVLGKGKRLFEPGTKPSAWTLESVARTPSGVQAQVYRFQGAPTHGTYGF
ncbi:dihydrofolate reductase family protein [Salininema proteolyticum]|uniref:Dihydrofolate reductase family protein n=1 Tax=Salininema proteolyticum TaxID=1607685 RepID=A0ABV8TVE7_9ACTN